MCWTAIPGVWQFGPAGGAGINRIVEARVAMFIVALGRSIQQPVSAITVSGAIAQQLLETVPHDLDSAREALIDIQNASTSIPQVLESLRRSFGNKSQREPKFVDVTR